jgi:hypothetical protein
MFFIPDDGKVAKDSADRKAKAFVRTERADSHCVGPVRMAWSVVNSTPLSEIVGFTPIKDTPW